MGESTTTMSPAGSTTVMPTGSTTLKVTSDANDWVDQKPKTQSANDDNDEDDDDDDDDDEDDVEDNASTTSVPVTTSSVLGASNVVTGSPSSTTTSSVAGASAATMHAADVSTSTVSPTTSAAMTTEAGSHAEDIAPVFRRLVIANKQPRGSKTWGLNHAKAEEACEDMVKIIHNAENGEDEANIKSIVDRMLGDIAQDTGIETHAEDLEGHLLSIHSNKEFDILRAFLSRLPSDVYWTGGKLLRMKGTGKASLQLKWTDGTTTDPFKLGFDLKKVTSLTPGKEYCLAFKTNEGQWQALDCSTKLPYACLLHHSKNRSTTGAPIEPASAITTGTSTVAPGSTTAGVSTTTSKSA